jgi:hypothetical protein
MLEVLLFKRLEIYFISDFSSSSTLVYAGSPNRPSTIVCIRMQWNHPDLTGCASGVGFGWAVTREQGVGAAI